MDLMFGRIDGHLVQPFFHPGWMFVPRKPHPFRNKYHTIGCGEKSILYLLELVEGKNMPKELPKLQGTSGLLLRLTKSLHGTGKLDSGFCVLKAFIALKSVDVFASA